MLLHVRTSPTDDNNYIMSSTQYPQVVVVGLVEILVKRKLLLAYSILLLFFDRKNVDY